MGFLVLVLSCDGNEKELYNKLYKQNLLRNIVKFKFVGAVVNM